MKCGEIISKINVDDNYKTHIIRKVIRAGLDQDGVIVKHCGRLYYVNVNRDEVIPQLERK
jgi:hypothetical protein